MTFSPFLSGDICFFQSLSWMLVFSFTPLPPYPMSLPKTGTLFSAKPSSDFEGALTFSLLSDVRTGGLGKKTLTFYPPKTSEIKVAIDLIAAIGAEVYELSPEKVSPFWNFFSHWSGFFFFFFFLLFFFVFRFFSFFVFRNFLFLPAAEPS